jgi:tRNA/rRNA methyltransferase/tRNA (cytidine32/uridine32-2'-O)-methyltransferase
MDFEDLVIILSRPAEPGNIGAVCRAMKNMGLSRLRLAAADAEALNDEVIRARAVHAADIWDQAGRFDSLEAAVADCALVIGATRRLGTRRKAWSLDPGEAAARLKAHPGPGALVFGNERTGLEDRELRLCNMASHIPSSEAFPSLNLSHAVQIYAYELFMAQGHAQGHAHHAQSQAQHAQGRAEGPAFDPDPKAPGPSLSRWVPLDQARLEDLSHGISDSLASLGFYKQPGREDQERFFRDIFSRAGITQREGAYLAAIFAKAARLANNRS